jgi:tape measure domain-containing protein
MATNSRVDLVIRAKDIQTKPIEDLEKIVDKLTNSLQEIEAAGGPAAFSVGELTTSVKQFETALQQISARKTGAELFKAQIENAAALKTALEKAETDLKTYSDSLESVKRKSKEQNATLAQLAAAVKAAASAFNKAEASVVKQGDKLEALGITAENVADQIERLGAAERALDAGERQAIKNRQAFEQASREAAAAAAAETAQLEQQADALRRLNTTDAEIQATEQKRLDGLKALDRALRAQREAELNAANALAEVANKADAAVAATRKLTDAADQLRTTPAAQTLAQQVGAIAAPARDAARSLSDMAGELGAIEARQKQAQGAWRLTQEQVKALAGDYETLQRTLRESATQASALDAFRRQRQELEATGAAIEEVRAKIAQYAAQARAGLGDNAIAEGLRDQQALLERLTGAYQRQSQALQSLGATAQRAGVGLDDVAKSEAAIVANAERARRALDSLATAQTKNGESIERTTQAYKNGFELQRTALSLMQRIRGQILSLTAAYVGLFGVVNEARESLAAASDLQRINTRLGVAFGDDPARTAVELEYVRSAAERLGVDLQTTAQGYSKFAIAAQSAGLSLQSTRDIFESFTTVSRVYGLTADDTSGVFRAIEQSLSKGKIQAEELTGQLGDRLPGVVNALARGLGVTTDELGKLLEQGKVKAGPALELLADELKRTAQGQIAPAAVRFDAEIGRLKTSLFEFRNVVADSGFLSSMTSLAKSLREFLRSAEGQEVARGLGQAFTSFANAARAAVPAAKGFIEVFSDIGSALSAVIKPLTDFTSGLLKASGIATGSYEPFRLVGQVVALMIVAMSAAKVVLWADAIAAAVAPTKLLTVATTALGRAVQLVLLPAFAALVGFEFGKYLYEQSDAAKKAGALLVYSFSVIIERIKGFGSASVSFVKLFVLSALEAVVTSITSRTKALAEVIAKAAEALGLQPLADNVRGSLGQFGQGLAASLTTSVADARAEVAADMAAMRKGVTREYEMLMDGLSAIDQEAAARTAKPPPKSARGLLNAADAELLGADAGMSEAERQALRDQITGGGGKPDKEAAKAARDRAAALREVGKAVEALSLRAARTDATETEDAVAALTQQYGELFDKITAIEAFNPRAAAVLRETAQAALDRLTAAVRRQGDFKTAQDALGALIAQRDAALDLVKAQAALDPAKRATLQADLNRVTADAAPAIADQADKVAALAKELNKQTEATKALTTAATTRAGVSTEAQQKAELTDKQALIASLTAERDARISVIDAQQAQGLVGVGEADAQRVAVMTEFRDRLVEAAIQARALAQALGDPTGVANYDALILKLQVVDEKALALTEKLKSDLVQGFTDVGLAAADGLAGAITGAESLGGAFVQAREAFKSFAASFLRNIARMLIEQQALIAVQAISRALSGGSPVSFAAPSFVPAGIMHTGGVVGTPGMTRAVDPSVFANARRYHSGGLPGLRSDEVATILQKGEEVLTRDDPRNVLNSNAGGGGIKIINTIDPGEVASAGLGTAAGQRALVNAVSMQRSSIKKILA